MVSNQIFNELFILISLINPATICLQETFLKENHNLKTLNYEQYHYLHNTGHRANGGTSILVRNDIPQSQFPIKSKLQAVTTQVTLHKTITIISIYIPPHEQINETKLKNLIKQLTKPFILLGDFNSHNTLSLELLLEIYNNIWTGKQFPKSWKQATIIPIPKPEKKILHTLKTIVQ